MERTEGTAAECGIRLFHILCSDGSRTGCLLCTDIDFEAFYVFGFWVNVRPYQTACTRTAGHWILEKPDAAFRGSPLLGFEGGCGVWGLVLDGFVWKGDWI